MLDGYRVSQAVHAAVATGIVDALADGDAPAAELASELGLDAAATERLLRLLSALGLVEEADRGSVAYRLLPEGAVLARSHPESVAAKAAALGAAWNWDVWGRLVDAIRTGVPAFEQVHGTASFDYLSDHPEAGRAFNERMTVEGFRRGAAAAEVAQLETADRVVDLGGGQGAFLAGLLTPHPDVRGHLFDLPSVVAGAGEVLRRYGLADRVTVEAGDFRERVPAVPGVWVLSAILHSWSDAAAVDLLRRCRGAMGRDGRLLLIDEAIDAGQPDALRLALKDLQLLVNTRGRQRRSEEFTQLLEEAGYRPSEQALTAAGDTVIEAVPAR